MYELVVIVPVVFLVGLNALAVLAGREGSSKPHRLAFGWGLTALTFLPLLLLALASSVLSIFNAGTGLAAVFAVVFGVLMLAASAISLVSLCRLPRAGTVA